jgi:hypothetical protein
VPGELDKDQIATLGSADIPTDDLRQIRGGGPASWQTLWTCSVVGGDDEAHARALIAEVLSLRAEELRAYRDEIFR